MSEVGPKAGEPWDNESWNQARFQHQAPCAHHFHELLPFFFFFNWRLTALQYCGGFCHTLTWISHWYTCVPLSQTPHPTSLPIRSLWVVPVHQLWEPCFTHRSLVSKCPLRFQALLFLHFELSDLTQYLERLGPFRFEALTLESTQLFSTVCSSAGFWRGADSGRLNALSRARLSGLWTV